MITIIRPASALTPSFKALEIVYDYHRYGENRFSLGFWILRFISRYAYRLGEGGGGAGRTRFLFRSKKIIYAESKEKTIGFLPRRSRKGIVWKRIVELRKRKRNGFVLLNRYGFRVLTILRNKILSRHEVNEVLKPRSGEKSAEA